MKIWYWTNISLLILLLLAVVLVCNSQQDLNYYRDRISEKNIELMEAYGKILEQQKEIDALKAEIPDITIFIEPYDGGIW